VLRSWKHTSGTNLTTRRVDMGAVCAPAASTTGIWRAKALRRAILLMFFFASSKVVSPVLIVSLCIQGGFSLILTGGNGDCSHTYMVYLAIGDFEVPEVPRHGLPGTILLALRHNHR